jgi:carbon monoxide dehydrogenase subunit G
MSKVNASIDIEATPEAVFDAMLDPTRLKEWVTIHRKVNRADGGTPREGFTMEQTLALRGAPFKVKWTLTQYEPPHQATWEGRGPGGSYARTAYVLSQNGGSGTHFEYENEYKAPGGVLGAAASRALVGGTSRKEAEKSLRRLKSMLEQ